MMGSQWTDNWLVGDLFEREIEEKSNKYGLTTAGSRERERGVCCVALACHVTRE